MSVQIVTLDDEYYLNVCTKHLARINPAKTPTWQFPIVDTHPDSQHQRNKVSFIYQTSNSQPVAVGVIGTFATLYEPIPLTPVRFLNEDTEFYAVTLLIPQGEVHRYKYIVNGEAQLDRNNPQQVTLDDNSQWSRFFTHHCFIPITFEEWELKILYRLLDHMMPFHTAASENFLARYYDGLDQQTKNTTREGFYRLDESVGEVNFIDKLLAKEESHHLISYRICLKEIDRLLRQRNPFIEPFELAKGMYVTLYNEMASGQVPGWDYNAYNNPLYFLQLLRRHAALGAFSHPKYGGNSGGAGWEFLAQRYQQDEQTLFDWQKAMELPLGSNSDYTG